MRRSLRDSVVNGRTQAAAASARERGSMTILAVGLTAAILVVLAGALAVASAVEASHRARAAADLSALAGADAWQAGAGPAQVCDRAGELARGNSAELEECWPEGDGSVTTAVTVSVRWPLAGAGHGTARAQARAGRGP